jgi:hypothetical protein
LTKKRKKVDCVEVKRRAQRKLAKALAGKTPEEQVATLRRLAARNPLWQQLAEEEPPAPRTARAPRKRRSAG